MTESAQNKVVVARDKLQSLIASKLSNQVANLGHDFMFVVGEIQRPQMLDVFKILKHDTDLQFNILLNLTAIDWLDQRESRFEVVYHLLSLSNLFRIRLKVAVSEHNPEVDSLSGLWSSANFMERECWDMYGIKFKGHPDLRRLLMYPEFEGHPLRKDFPVQGKQPRIAMLHPEFENTARNRVRSELVSINSRRKDAMGAT